MAFSPPVVGCFVKKGLQKGGSRAPQDPPWLRPCLVCINEWFRTFIGYIKALGGNALKRAKSKR